MNLVELVEIETELSHIWLPVVLKCIFFIKEGTHALEPVGTNCFKKPAYWLQQ